MLDEDLAVSVTSIVELSLYYSLECLARNAKGLCGLVFWLLVA